jgi:hypothetical protein
VTAQEETVAVDVLLGSDSTYVNMAEPRPSDTTGATLWPLCLRGWGCLLGLSGARPWSQSVWEHSPKGHGTSPRSLGAADPGVAEPRLPGYPGASSLPVS